VRVTRNATWLQKAASWSRHTALRSSPCVPEVKYAAAGDRRQLAAVVVHEECGRTREWCHQQKRWHLREGCASDIMHGEDGGPGEL
jgi:hypothetical protein